MNTQVKAVGTLTEAQVHAVLTAATAAQDSRAVHIRCTATIIELSADPARRAVVLACGAALLNLRLAIRALGVLPMVQLVPDPDRPDLLAVVRPLGKLVVTPAERRLTNAIPRRRTARAPFTGRAVSLPVLNGLRQAAKAEQAWLATLGAQQLPPLRTLLTEADPAHTGNGFVADSLIAVIGSFHDETMARLQAGQAMQRVLLAATAGGLSAAFLPSVVEKPDTRRQLRGLIGGALWPQTLLWLGYEAGHGC
ncbi:hypothetical protein [Amycolatopsis sp. NPDC059657]|uniref:hypothetical protein n=1 Tax=Amycolatopsis sp. NPDC059657 TaxID=3346899 RepID=UPI00366EF260